VDVSPSLIADAQPPKLVKPGQCPLHHPAVYAQAAAVLSQTLREHWLNPQGAQHFPMGPGVVGTVSLNSVRPMAWSATLASHWRNCFYQGQQLGNIVTVGTGQNGGQGDSLGIGDHVVLAARFAPVRGIGPCFSPHHLRRGWTHYPPQLVTNQSGQPHAVWSAAVHGASARPLLPAIRVGVASRSCLSHTPSPGVTSPTGSRSSRRRGCRSTPSCCPAAFAQDRVGASAWGVAGGVESGPIVRRLPGALPSVSPSLRRNYRLPPKNDKTTSTHFVSSS
jgi:hypothetical protein